MTQAWVPDLIYADGRFRSNVALVCDGTVKRVCEADED